MSGKIYFVAPEGDSTGGVETLHQAVSYINDMGGDAYIVYCKNIWDKEYLITEPVVIEEKFKRYNIQVAKHVEDSSDNVFVVPEIFSKFCYQFKKIKKIIWWLSWNFFEDRSFQIRASRYMKDRHLPQVFARPAAFWYTISKGKQFTFGKDKNDIFHLYNCEFIHQLLLLKGIKEENTCYMCGMIRDEYLEADVDITKKENIVIYNPAKDKNKFAEKVFNSNHLDQRGYQIIPIQNMKPAQIKELMGKSKLYIDFGYFPGPERMPREAMAMRCNLITSNIGAAANDIDVPIPHKYKYAPVEENISEIGKCMIELIENYSMYQDEFEAYWKKVMNQKKIFQENLKKIFLKRD